MVLAPRHHAACRSAAAGRVLPHLLPVPENPASRLEDGLENPHVRPFYEIRLPAPRAGQRLAGSPAELVPRRTGATDRIPEGTDHRGAAGRPDRRTTSGRRRQRHAALSLSGHARLPQEFRGYLPGGGNAGKPPGAEPFPHPLHHPGRREPLRPLAETGMGPARIHRLPRTDAPRRTRCRLQPGGLPALPIPHRDLGPSHLGIQTDRTAHDPGRPALRARKRVRCTVCGVLPAR